MPFPVPDFWIKQGALLPPLAVITRDSQDAPLPLTNYTSVHFRLRNRLDGTLKVDAAAAVDDAPGGKISYTWATGDTDTDGFYDGEFEVVFPGNKSIRFPTTGHLLVEIVGNVR